MATEEARQDLPERPRSAFSGHVERGKDGRVLGGCTTEEFRESYWTEERKEAQRQKAKQLIAEGKFGAANGFHRRKVKRFQEIVAEKAQEKADEIWKELENMIFGQQKDKRLKLEAIRELEKMEEFATKNAREDEREFRSMTNQQLDSRLLEMLGEAIGVDLSDVVDGEIVEEGPLELEAGQQYDPLSTILGGDRLREAAAILAEAEEDDDDE